MKVEDSRKIARKMQTQEFISLSLRRQLAIRHKIFMKIIRTYIQFLKELRLARRLMDYKIVDNSKVELKISSNSMNFNYEPIEHPPLHPRCRCVLIPVIREGYNEENPMVHHRRVREDQAGDYVFEEKK